MKKVIELNLQNKADFYDCYNPKRVSSNVVFYLLQEVHHFSKKDLVEVHIFNSIQEKNCVVMIQEQLKREYEKCQFRTKRNNLIQLLYFLVGICMLCVSILIDSFFLFDELFLIGGWVFIWSMIEIEIHGDYENNLRKQFLKQLLAATYQIEE